MGWMLWLHHVIQLSLSLSHHPIAQIMFASQMKQSLEKLHRGIVVPEVQQDATDTHTESITEAWALYRHTLV